MPNKTVEFLLKEFDLLKQQFSDHIQESGTIKTDLRWLKWFVMGIAGGLGTLLILVIVAIVGYIFKR